ncbi:MAG: hydroxyacid dehydrogenase [Desulfuromonadales bacterium]|nr:hydroxyacid dehydrogenase [Desulfuromonadales bacterium]
MKVHIFEPIHPDSLTLLRENVEVVGWEDPNVQNISTADAIIVRAAKVDRQIMESAPDLKVIGKHGVGVDSIDVVAARNLGIKVVYTPGANLEGVAELAVAFMLTMSRKIPYGHNQLRAGAYTTVCPKELTGTELMDKTVGLVGVGRIGQRIAEILNKGFNMKVIGFDPFLSDDNFENLGIEKIVDIERLLLLSDYISINVPLTIETKNLINAERLAFCKPGAILVNTARGGIVDEEALYEVLNSGGLRAAASDVFIDEPLNKDHPLFSLPNFVALPHVGASTEESLVRMGETVVADVLRILKGEPPLYPVPGA